MLKRREVKVGLALGGGAAKGLAHLGVLQVLESEQVPIDCIAGTSIGAVIGAMYALNPSVDEILNGVKDFLGSDHFREIGLSLFSKEGNPSLFRRLTTFVKEKYIYSRALFKPYFIPSEKVHAALRLLLEDVSIQDMSIPFATVSTDLASGEDRMLRDGSLLTALAASIAIPGVFPYVERGSEVLVDGGGTSSVPVDAARSLGADMVIAVNLSCSIGTVPPLRSGLDLNFRLDEIVKHRLNELQLRRADVVVEPMVGSVHWADFSRLDFCLEKGREAALAQLGEARKRLREKASFWRRLMPTRATSRSHPSRGGGSSAWRRLSKR